MMYEKLQSKDTSSLKNQTNPYHSQEQQEHIIDRPFDINMMRRLQQSMGNMAMPHMLQSMFSESNDTEYEQVRDEMNEQSSTPENVLRRITKLEGEEQESQEDQLEAKSISEILAMAPASSTRTRDDMERDIRLAQLTVDKVIAESTSLDEVSSYFPLLQLRFGLKNIELQGAGTPDVQVALEINPKGACLIKNANEFVLNKGESHGLPDKQDVTFKTGQSSSGHTWATEMVAKQLGPNHPQGFGPTEQRALMRHLPTNRKNHPGVENRYIRGHLLNDSLGGPGLEQNMFPITERANKDHESYVESTVKDWVNNLGYFVYYHVEVKNIRETLDVSLYDDANNFVDADLHCEAYVIAVDGSRSKLKGYINRIIKSEHAVYRMVADKQETTLSGVNDPDNSHKKIVDKRLVELSVTKDKGEKGYDTVIPEVADGIIEFFEEFKQYITKDQIFYSTLAQLIEPRLNKVSTSNLSLVFKAIVLDSSDGKQQVQNIQGVNFSKVGNWNHITNELSKKKDVISDLLDNLTSVIDLYNDLQEDEKQLLCENVYRCYDRMLLNRMLDDYMDVDNKIIVMENMMYEQGMEDAEFRYEPQSDSLAYMEGYRSVNQSTKRQKTEDFDQSDDQNT